MSLEFKPTIKSINIANEDLTKITLEVKNGTLDGQYDELRKLSGKTVLIAILPDSYTYVQQFDRSTKTPITEWIVNSDGTVEIKKTEQTQLDVDGQGNIDIQNIEKKVDRDIIDEFIMKATSFEVPSHININPRGVIDRLRKGEDLGDIADDYEMSDSALLNELEKARLHYAPFADYWTKHQEDIVFQDTSDSDDAEDSEDDPETTEDEE